MFDNVNKPKHYNIHPSGIECIQVTRYLNFNCGNAYKYLFRRDHKNELLENLKKSLWYLDDEIAYNEHTLLDTDNLDEYKSNAEKISEHEPVPFDKIMLLIALGFDEDIKEARDLLAKEIERIKNA